MLLLWELRWYKSIDKFIWGRISIVNKNCFQTTKTEAATGQVDQAAGDIPVYPALSDYKSIWPLCRDGIVVHRRVTPVGIHTNGCGVKRDWIEVNYQRTKHSFPGQGSNTDRSICASQFDETTKQKPKSKQIWYSTTSHTRGEKLKLAKEFSK